MHADAANLGAPAVMGAT
jgi:hypothetical protein